MADTLWLFEKALTAVMLGKGTDPELKNTDER